MQSVQMIVKLCVAVAVLAVFLLLSSAQSQTTPSGAGFFGCPDDLPHRVNTSYLLCIRDVMNGTTGQTTTRRPDEDQLLKSNADQDVIVSDEEYESEEYNDGEDRDLRNAGGFSAAQQRRWARTAMYSCMVRRLMRHPFVQMLASDCSGRGSETRQNRCIMRSLRRGCPRAFAPITIGASLMNRR